MSKHFNLLVLVLIVAVSALLARGFWRSPDLQSDLKQALDRLWSSPRNEVEVTAAGDVRMRLWIPPGTPEGQKQWTFPLCRWVAGQRKLTSLTVTDATAEQPLKEAGLSRGSLTVPDNALAARRELLQRSLQAALNRLAGPSRILALVDVSAVAGVSSWLPNVPADPALSPWRYGRRSGVGQAAPSMEESALVRPVQRQAQQIAVCLVFRGRTEPALVQRARETVLSLTQPTPATVRDLILDGL